MGNFLEKENLSTKNSHILGNSKKVKWMEWDKKHLNKVSTKDNLLMINIKVMEY